MIRTMTARPVGDEIWIEGPNLKGQPLRWIFSQITSHSFHWSNFVSEDGGQTWCLQKVTASYWEGLFVCYQVTDLPRTNNDLEQFFGTARHVERRATGRKRASPTLVVRGSVRVVAAGASRILSVSAAELRPPNIVAWQALRQTLDYRQEGRRKQLRFRRDPQTYLASLEERLCRSSLPS